MRKAKLGPDHPDTLNSMSNLALSYDALGRHADALKLNQETLALRTIRLGPHHPHTLQSMSYLADNYAAVGRHAEALKLREETLALQKTTLGPNHSETLLSMGYLADSLVTVDRGAEAVPIIDECLKRAAGKVVDPHLVPTVLDLRLRHFAKIKAAAGCRLTAEMWEQLNHIDAGSLYTAACMRAVTAAVIKEDATTPAAEAARFADEEADRAMAWLRQAVAKGYKDIAHLKKDADLKALREREDFQKLVKELEERPPSPLPDARP